MALNALQNIFGGTQTQQQSNSASDSFGTSSGESIGGSTGFSSGNSSGTSQGTSDSLSGGWTTGTSFGNTAGSSFSTPTDFTPEAFANLRNPFASALQGLVNSGGGPTYSGPLSANIGTNESNLLQQLMGQSAPNNNRNALLNQTIGGNFLPGQPGANPYFDAAVQAAQRPTLQGLEETLTRSLPGRFTSEGGQFTQPHGSSAFDRAAGVATRGVAQAIGDIATNMGSNAYTSERQNQQNAIPLSQAEVDTTVKNLQAQALPRLISELNIERAIPLFNQKSQQLFQVLQMLSGVTGVTLGQTSGATNVGTQGSQQQGAQQSISTSQQTSQQQSQQQSAQEAFNRAIQQALQTSSSNSQMTGLSNEQKSPFDALTKLFSAVVPGGL